MKYRARIPVLLMACLLLFACASDRKDPTGSQFWHLSERYPVTYSQQLIAYSYEKNGQIFYLTVTKNKHAGTDKSATVLQTEEHSNRTYTLCSRTLNGKDTSLQYTFYEYTADAFRFFLGNEEAALSIENVLSIDEAIALFEQPTSPNGDIVLLKTECSAYFRLASCNLEISIYPNDDGKQYRISTSDAEQRTEDGETYLYVVSDNRIIYTNGTDTVTIRQTNRSGEEHVAYNTLSECKALLAMLRAN